MDPVGLAAAAVLAAGAFNALVPEDVGGSLRDMLASLRRRSRFRTLVLQALQLDAGDHGQSLEYPSGTASTTSPDGLDALLPEGLGDLPGPLGVELWFPAAGGGSVTAL